LKEPFEVKADVSIESMADDVMDLADTHSPVLIKTIGCVTRDRVEGLQRALTSYIENNRRFGRTNDFAVMDDSPAPAMRNSYRRMLRGLKSERGVEILYAGFEEKIRFAKKLIDTKAMPAEVVRAALFDVENFGLVTIGANLNALLLHTIGDPLLSVDDDTVCRIALAPELSEQCVFGSTQRFSPVDPCEVYTFADRDAALSAANFALMDILAIHERFLGQSMRGSLSASISKDETSARGRVAVTLNGLLGDCGWGSPFYYLLLNDDSLRRLVQSEASYRASCTSREMWRTVNAPTISAATDNMMATFFGLDNRQLLPPFIPITRGADYIFGVTISKCFDDLLFAHLPWSLLHLPLEVRKFSQGEITRSAAGVDIDALVSVLLKSCEFDGGETHGAEKLKKVGAHLEALGTMHAPQFAEFARAKVVDEIAALILHLEERLSNSSNAPDYWRQDVERCVAVLRQSALREDVYLPLDLLYNRSPDEAREKTRRLVQKFGQLLRWWPEMRLAAHGLRENGHRLAQPV
jgi:hypothetical protein